MSEVHTGDDMDECSEEFYRRVVLGEIDVDSEEVAARRRGDPEFTRALVEWQSTIDALASARRERSAALHELQSCPNEDADRLAARRFLDRRLSSRERRRRAAIAWAAAATAAILLGASLLGVFDTGGRTGGRSGPLDGRPGRPVPVGPVERVDHFVVPAAIPTGGRLVIRVLDQDGGDVWEIRREADSLTEPRLDLDEERIRSLPRRFRWSYEIVDGTGEPVSSGAYDVEIVGPNRGS